MNSSIVRLLTHGCEKSFRHKTHKNTLLAILQVTLMHNAKSARYKCRNKGQRQMQLTW